MDPNYPQPEGFSNQGYFNQAPPVMMQPSPGMPMHTTNTNTTVVIGGQPAASYQVQTDFRSGICGCFDDFGTCCVVTILSIFGCLECYGCHLSMKMGESCFLCGCVPGYLTALRAKLRAEKNIRGTICDDCVVTSCCRPCAMCQIARELDINH